MSIAVTIAALIGFCTIMGRRSTMMAGVTRFALVAALVAGSFTDLPAPATAAGQRAHANLAGVADLPTQCSKLVESTGRSVVNYLANVAVSMEKETQKCRDSCVASVCENQGHIALADGPERFAETKATLVKVDKHRRSALRVGGASGCRGYDCGAGTCVEQCTNGKSNSPKCICPSGFAGARCQTRVCGDRGCGDNGVCSGDGKCVCNPGFTGQFCDRKEECPKFNDLECGGASRGNCHLGKCFCLPGYSGESCDKKNSCPQNCNDNGVCSDGGRCTCFSGWEGDACSVFKSGKSCDTKSDGPVCSNRGLCFHGKCICEPSFTGASCEIRKQCANRCSGHGVCWAGKCLCEPAFDGDDCSVQKPCNCNGHGDCSLGSCRCEPGWTGSACATQETCPGASSESPAGCSGHGVCSQGACFCYPGFIGDTCAISTAEMKEEQRVRNCMHNGKSCNGHGVCAYGLTANKDASPETEPIGTCLCDGGWYGPVCQEMRECPNQCRGHGQCIGGQCYCLPGYSGEDCSIFSSNIELCANKCSGHGTCMLGMCYCEPGFGGASCNVTETCPIGRRNGQTCAGHGECKYGRCYCGPGYTGEDCASREKCPRGCSNNGVCFEGKCLCTPGFTGDDCAVSSCGGVTCENGAICHKGKCFCKSGYTGDNCEHLVPEPSTIDIASVSQLMGNDGITCPVDADGNSCSGHGSCGKRVSPADGASCAVCSCDEGFHGFDCSKTGPADTVAAEKPAEDAADGKPRNDQSAVDRIRELLDMGRNNEARSLLETQEIPRPCGSAECDETVCGAAGGTCMCGVGCVCPAGVRHPLCAESVQLAVNVDTNVGISSLAAAAPGATASTTNANSWGTPQVIFMSFCMVGVGVALTMGVAALRQRRTGAAKAAADEVADRTPFLHADTSVASSDRVADEADGLHAIDDAVPSDHPQIESVASGFISR